MDKITFQTVQKVLAAKTLKQYGFKNSSGKFRLLLPNGDIVISNKSFTRVGRTVYVYKSGRWESPQGRPATLIKDFLPTLNKKLQLMGYKTPRKSFTTKVPKGAKKNKTSEVPIDKLSSRKKDEPLAQAKKKGKRLTKVLQKAGMKGIKICGSIRREKPVVGDIDMMAQGTLEKIKALKSCDFIKGKEKTITFMFENSQVNLYKYEPKYAGAMMLFLTGPGEYNIALRRIAKKKGLKLSQYGIFKGSKLIASETEEDMYAALGKSFKEPFERGKKVEKKTKKLPKEPSNPPSKISWKKLRENPSEYIKTLSTKQLAIIMDKAAAEYYNQ